MTKNQRNDRNTTPGKVTNVAIARSISLQKQSSSNKMQQQTEDVKESDIIQKQQKIIEEPLNRLGRLEGTVSAMCMIVTGLRRPGKDETNDEDSKRVISVIASETALDEVEFTNS